MTHGRTRLGWCIEDKESESPVLQLPNKPLDLSSASTDAHRHTQTDVQWDGLGVAIMVELLSCCRQVGH